ncbi:MAG: nucleotidyltransferase family protein [Candidatus Bathyarchaeota archaeon]|nr:nucleotidyltransferase family protein [Candidatus Bathyarchaeota archaeon]
MKHVKGVIMAGGMGTRFKPLSHYLQKCMIPIGIHEKPIMEYIVRLYEHHKINDLVLLVGYKHQQIQNYFNGGERFGVKMKYIVDDPNLKGSANATLNAYRQGAITEDDTAVIYYGDIISNIDLREMVEFHHESEAKATIALAPSLKINEGVADIKGGWIHKFREKPNLDLAISIGILILDGSVMPEMERLQGMGQHDSFDIMGDVVQHLVNSGEKVASYITEAFWYDMGSIERYERLSTEKIEEELGFLLK